MLNRRNVLLAAAALAGATALPARARTFADENFPDEIELDGTTLLLNGVGARSVRIYNLYLAALYTSKKSNNADAICAMAGPKRVEMRSEIPVGVSTDELVKAVNKSVDRNATEAEKAVLPNQLPALFKNIQAVGKLYKGDVVHIDYLPGRGTQLSVNGKAFGTPTPGAEAYVAVLKSFIGEQVSDSHLRDALLGIAPPTA